MSHCRPSRRPAGFYDNFPGFNNLRGWARLGFFVELSVGLLAAAGLDSPSGLDERAVSRARLRASGSSRNCDGPRRYSISSRDRQQ